MERPKLDELCGNHILTEGIPVEEKGPCFHKKRAFPSSSAGEEKRGRARGSLTLEAALVLPLFLFFIIVLLYFLVIVSLQSDIQMAMEETARSIGKKAYLAEHTAASSGSGADGQAGALSAGINSMTIKAWMLKDGLGERIRRSRIQGGVGGFYVYHSGYDRKEGVLDIVVNYTYVFPFLPERIGKVRFVQRCRSHVWTGSRLQDGTGGKGGDGKETETVYVTPYGTVYHLSRDCSYLDLSVHGISGSEVAGARNKDGGKYYMCTDCCKKGQTYDTVYVTDYGTNWHSDLHCTGLKRTVEEISLSEAGGRHACPKCGGEH